MDLLTFQGGKIVSDESGSNSVEMLTRLGVMKVPAAAPAPKK